MTFPKRKKNMYNFASFRFFLNVSLLGMCHADLRGETAAAAEVNKKPTT